MDALMQHPLPGLDAVERAPARRRDHTRVWTDPAVGDSRVAGDKLHVEWRDAFTHFIARLPASQRAEIRRKIGSARSAA